MNILRRSFIAFVMLMTFLQPVVMSAADVDSSEAAADTVVRKRNIIDKVIDYFSHTNDQHTDGRFDVSFIGGPHYSSDTKLGIGLVAAGTYSAAPGDTLTPLSNVSLYGDITSVGCLTVGIRGNQIFRGDNYRLNYDVSFTYFPNKFWGIGFGQNINDKNETDYDLLESELIVEFLMNAGRRWYVGPVAQFNYVKGANADNLALWNGEEMRTFNYGVGVSAQYDTRDNLTNPHCGWYLRADQIFLPRFMGNDYAFSRTEAKACHYHPVWSGGVLAGQLHADINYGNVPWGMLATIGGNHSMRGYYKGRFRDKGEIDFTLELRQHIYGRSGVAVWAGLASVFPRFSDITFDTLLPNCGVGYRWEFKKDMNVRIDVGFGRRSCGFIFGINEAF